MNTPALLRIAPGALALALVGGLALLLFHRPAPPPAPAVAPAPSGPSSLEAFDHLPPPPPTARQRPPQRYDYQAPALRLAGVTLRPMDIDIFQAIESGTLQRTQLGDLFPDRPYKVKLVGSVEMKWISTVLVDLQRDGIWDERWELKENEVTRRVLVDGDLEGSTPFALRPGRWLPY